MTKPFDAPLRMPGDGLAPPVLSDPAPIAGLDPGIVKVVAFLRKNGFHTTDSGDGVTKLTPGYDPDCVMDIPHVFMQVQPATMLVDEANRLSRLLRMHFAVRPAPANMRVEASYDPTDRIAILALTGLDDAALP